MTTVGFNGSGMIGGTVAKLAVAAGGRPAGEGTIRAALAAATR
jgi:hypothetical protein